VGLSCHRAAAQFGVGVSTAIRWVDRLRMTGSVSTEQRSALQARAQISGEHRTGFLARNQEKDFTLLGWRATRRARSEGRLPFGSGTFVHDEKLSFKKNHGGCERARPDVARRRAAMDQYTTTADDPSPWCFIDETLDSSPTWSNLCALSPARHRLIAKPEGPLATMTFLPALRHYRIERLGCSKARSTRQLHHLCREGSAAHLTARRHRHHGQSRQSQGARSYARLIRSAGAKLFLLPKYSPDLNPIEQVFSKLKQSAAQSRAPEPPKPSVQPSANCLALSPATNAPTISKTQDMHQTKCITPLALLWQILRDNRRHGIPKSVFR
jgi:transposase